MYLNLVKNWRKQISEDSRSELILSIALVISELLVISVIFNWILVAKHIRDPRCHLSAATISWFILIKMPIPLAATTLISSYLRHLYSIFIGSLSVYDEQNISRWPISVEPKICSNNICSNDICSNYTCCFEICLNWSHFCGFWAWFW